MHLQYKFDFSVSSAHSSLSVVTYQLVMINISSTNIKLIEPDKSVQLLILFVMHYLTVEYVGRLNELWHILLHLPTT